MQRFEYVTNLPPGFDIYLDLYDVMHTRTYWSTAAIYPNKLPKYAPVRSSRCTLLNPSSLAPLAPASTDYVSGLPPRIDRSICCCR